MGRAARIHGGGVVVNALTPEDMAQVARSMASDLGCAPGDVDMQYGPICASNVHVATRHHGQCEFVANVVENITPTVEAIVARHVTAALTDAANAWTQGAWANTPWKSERAADRLSAVNYFGDWLRARADRIPDNTT